MNQTFDALLEQKVTNIFYNLYENRMFPSIDEYAKEMDSFRTAVKHQDLKINTLYDSVILMTQGLTNIESQLKQENAELKRMLIQQDAEYSSIHENLSNQLEFQRIELERLETMIYSKKIRKSNKSARTDAAAASETTIPAPATANKKEVLLDDDMNPQKDPIQNPYEFPIKETDYSEYIRKFKQKYSTLSENGCGGGVGGVGTK